MRPKYIAIDPDNVDDDGISALASGTSGSDLTLGGDLTAGGAFEADYPRRIGIYSTGNDAGVTFTVTGTDPDGKALSEDVTGSSGSTSETTEYFSTITSISPDGATASTVKAGTVDEFVTNTIPLNHYASDAPTVTIEGISGTIDVTVQKTFSNVQASTAPTFFDGPAGVVDITADATDEIDNHITGVRLQCNSYTNGASLRMNIHQNG